MKKIIISMMLVSSLLIVGCSTHIHTVGYGPQSGIVKTDRQFYLLGGLIPINTVDAQAFLGEDPINYEIRTETGAVDVFIIYSIPIISSIMGIPIIPGVITCRTVKYTL